MDDKFLNYYERELTFIREMGAEFAKKYPKIAGRLLLEPDKCEDPHTERLIEAFAFLSARIHKKIDDDFPEITESLLNILYPHYISPIPSMSVVRFEPVKKTIPPVGYRIEKRRRPLFQTCRGHSLPVQHLLPRHPLAGRGGFGSASGAQEAGQRGPAGHRHSVEDLQSASASPSSSGKSLRFFLNGPSQHVFHLYELLFNNVCHVECESTEPAGNHGSRSPLNPDDDQAGGFRPGRGHDSLSPEVLSGLPSSLRVLLLSRRNFSSSIFTAWIEPGIATPTTPSTIWIYLDRIAKSNLVVNEETFCLHATPVVNLFERVAEPIRVEQQKTEYQVIPDI